MANVIKVPTVKLNRTGDGFPVLGLGVWKAPKGETATIVEVRADDAQKIDRPRFLAVLID